MLQLQTPTANAHKTLDHFLTYVFSLALPIALFLLPLVLANTAQAQTSADWYMAGANPQRTSWVSEEVWGLSTDWYRPIEPYIPYKIQPIAVNNKIYISTSKGLYAFNANTGSVDWVYATNIPLGHSPTIIQINGQWIAFVGSYDHTIHALDANTGQALNGYIPHIAEAGFETNPLVINNTIYAGNRDGYFYALDALTGALKWRYKTDGQILFSAAYFNNTVYFASMDNHAYALNANTGQLVWKKGPFPGSGFRSYWPVIFDRGNGEVYISFSGGENYRTSELHLTVQESEIIEANYPAGNYGDMYEDDPNRTTDYAHRRSVYILNATNGNEYSYDHDSDGKPSYPPFIWSGVTQSGTRSPAVIVANEYYQQTGTFPTEAWITTGTIARWQFGTPNYTFVTGNRWATDEPAIYSAGGNVIYGSLCCDRGSQAYRLSPASTWTIHGYRLGGLNLSLNIGEDMYRDKDNDISGTGNDAVNGWQIYSGRNQSDNGVYGKHGNTQSPPIPYQSRLYLIKNNTLIAMSPSGTGQKLPLATIQATTLATTVPDKSVVSQRLTDEIAKMLQAGHLKPGYLKNGFMDIYGVGGILSESWFPNYGELFDYFSNPSETVITLLQAIPHLNADQQSLVRSYLQTHYGPGAPYDFTRYVHVGFGSGTDRHNFIIPADTLYPTNPTGLGAPYESPLTKQDRAKCGWCGYWDFNPPLKAYAGWLYAKEFGNATQMYNLVNSLDMLPSDLTELKRRPYLLNFYAAGFYGHLQLADLAGQPRNSTVQNNYNRAKSELINNFSKDNPYTTNNNGSWDKDWGYRMYMRPLSIARNFMYLTPEIADDIYAPTLSTQVQSALDEFNYVAPYWFVSAFDNSVGEGTSQHLYDPPALFQAKAYILNEPYELLVPYLDSASFMIGDLFYIQNLVAALEAHSDPSYTPAPTQPPPPTPSAILGDTDGDLDVDLVDYQTLLDEFNTTNCGGSCVADFDNDGSITIFDFNILVTHFGQ
jgi:outer membrane protein assembly factor BamB